MNVSLPASLIAIAASLLISVSTTSCSTTADSGPHFKPSDNKVDHLDMVRRHRHRNRS